MQIQEILPLVEQSHGVAGRKIVEQAFFLMKKAHEGQFRIAGPEYFIHPEAVAGILAEQGYTDPKLLAATLMHDVVEDTKTTLEEIRTAFGETIAFLVDGVTDYGEGDDNTHIPDKNERMSATQKKVLAYGRKDTRIFLIKVADRIHNLETIDVLSQEKQTRMKNQTRTFHKKLAQRIGDEHFIKLLDTLLQE